MRIDWKVSAISASAAFLLSVLAGIIGGVSFGALLVRAVVGAMVFGVGAIGVSVAIDRFLPELKAAAASESSDNPGGNVDIVVEGDDSDVLVPATADLQMGGDDEGDLAADLSASVDDDQSPVELSEEFETGEADSESEGPALADVGTGAGDEESEQVEELAAADKLPDVEGFAESFSETPTESSVSSIESGTDPADDPTTMAKAIRTLLKREE